MDIFVEQLLTRKIKKSELLLKVAMFALCGITAGLVFLVLLGFAGGRYFIFSFLIAAVLIYLAYFASSKFNVEFEYCLTNGTFDVDTIVNMKNRKRLATFDCKNVDDFGVFEDGHDYKCASVVYAANYDAPDKYYMIYNHKEKGKILVVIEPNEKMLNGLKRCLPRQMVVNVFGNKIQTV